MLQAVTSKETVTLTTHPDFISEGNALEHRAKLTVSRADLTEAVDQAEQDLKAFVTRALAVHTKL